MSSCSSPRDGKLRGGRVRGLLTTGVDFSAESVADTPLIAAAESGHIDIVKVLLDAGADANSTPLLSYTTLLSAATEQGRTEIAELLRVGGVK